MIKQIVKIPVHALRKGLYVSRLDRPWIESPFLFQGFEIETDQELAQLRELCEVVYIELTSDEADELLKSTQPKRSSIAGADASQSLSELARDPSSQLSRVPAKDPIALKAELNVAKGIYGEARKAVTTFFDRLRRGGGLDVQLIGNVVDSMVDSIFRNREAMGWLAQMKLKDDYLYSHSLATSVWALAFGRHLGLDRRTLRSVAMGAMLLDIGKTQIPTEILRKAQELDAGELSMLRGHVKLGLSMVERDPRADDCVRAMIRTHHERIDGSGYPDRLAGEAIPFAGRIAGIVDCYDAMTSERAYAKSKSTYQAVLELKKLGKTWFQPELVELFIQAVGVFPTGALVELNTGEVGVVTAQNRFRRLRPEIMLILDSQKRVRDDFTLIDLQMFGKNNDAGNQELWITCGLEQGAYGIDPAEYFL
jgi:HD-GYP domain-containing protein (c-di-GMP phosphodiesterase class II)